MSEYKNYTVEEWQEKEEKEKFKITDLESAEWALKKLRALTKKEENTNNYAKKEISKIETWQREKQQEIAREKSYFEGLLQLYLMEQREKDKKFKIDVPTGKVSTKKNPNSIKITDPAALLEIIKNTDYAASVIKTEEKVLIPELKKHISVIDNKIIDENGEILQGVTIEEGEVKLSVKFS